jgi:hypothetical protein
MKAALSLCNGVCLVTEGVCGTANGVVRERQMSFLDRVSRRLRAARFLQIGPRRVFQHVRVRLRREACSCVHRRFLQQLVACGTLRSRVGFDRTF